VPDLTRLNAAQLMGIACVRCGERLGSGGRVIDEVEDVHGNPFRLWECAPACRLPRRQRYAAWPPGGPPRAP
jgi:hypothetical protein